MAREEDELARIDAGAVEFDTNELKRKARYAEEDAHTARIRAAEDALAAGGVSAREAKIAEIKAAIAARDAAKPMTVDDISVLKSRMAKMEAELAEKSAPVAPAAPAA